MDGMDGSLRFSIFCNTVSTVSIYICTVYIISYIVYIGFFRFSSKLRFPANVLIHECFVLFGTATQKQ